MFYASGEPRSRLRGVFHIALTLAIPPGAYFLLQHSRTDMIAACAVYTAAIFSSYLASALYHRGRWSIRAETVIRRLDHAAIYSNITASYIPAAMLLDSTERVILLVTIAAITVTGWMYCAVKQLAEAEGRVGLALYALAAACIMPFMPDIYPELSHLAFTATVATWVQIAMAAAVYSRRPETFGYHEVFHLLISSAAITTAVSIWEITKK